MEPTAAWGHCEFHQLVASWTVEEPAAPAQVWAPVAGLPVEYASIDICGTYSLQAAYLPESSGRHDPVEKEAQESLIEVALHNIEMEEIYNNNAIRVFVQVACEFEADVDLMKLKMHRYPASIRGDLGNDDWYTMPRIVVIGPYHHGRDQLKKVEQAKHAAVYHCIRESGCSVREIYDAVVSVADDARRLYDKDVMACIGYEDFRHMMFFDACFLVQYMVWRTDLSKEMDRSLRSFFFSNRKLIIHDVWLLENQLPWRVVETVMRFRPVPMKEFVAPWINLLQSRRALEGKSFALDDSCQPPHFLVLHPFSKQNQMYLVCML